MKITKLLLNVVAASALGLFAIGCAQKTETTTTTTSGDTSIGKGASTATTTDSGAKSTSTASSTAMSGDALAGQKIFYSTSFGKVKVSCSSCHTDGQATTSDSRIRSGHTLAGVASRTSTWNGAYKGASLKSTAHGAAQCAVMYERHGDEVATALTAAEANSLEAYYTAIQSAAGAMTQNLKIQWVTAPAIHDGDQIDDKAATAATKAILKLPGDAVSGQALYGKTCQYCHDIKNKKVGPPMEKAFKDVNFGTQSVRVGSGAMTFYAKDVLSDQQIADVVAYIQGQLGK